MKKSILLCFLVLNGAIVFGQSKKKSKKPKNTTEVDLNATYLARNFFGAEDDVTSISDYLLYYKIIKGNNAMRFGLGGSINQRVEDIPGNGQEVFGSILNARIGYERRIGMGKNWIYYYGIDFIFHYDRLETRTINLDDLTEDDTYLEFGAGPILGLQYMINEHIGIATETGIFAFFSTFNQTEESVNFPEINKDQRFDQFRIAAIPPINVYLSVKF